MNNIIELLEECKQALFNVNAVQCYNSGDFPCECTMCKINNKIEELSTIELKVDHLGFCDIYLYDGLFKSREANRIYEICKAIHSAFNYLNLIHGVNFFYLKSEISMNKEEIINFFKDSNYKLTFKN